MSTLQVIRSRLANEIGNYDLLDQYDHALRGAIERHEGERFAFNGVRHRLDTVAGQEFYTLPASLTTPAGSALAPGEDIIEIESATLRWGSTGAVLTAETPDALELYNSTASTGQPCSYARDGASFRVGPIPNGVYSIHLIGLGRLSTLTASGDTNAWLTQAPALVIAAAKVILARDALRDDKLYGTAVQQEAEALAQLRRKGSANLKHRIQPWGY